jgi:hypothetical protein
MKTRIFLLFIFFLAVRLSAQTAITAQSLTGVWLIDSGAFPMDIVKLKAYEIDKDSSRSYSGYEFSKNGTVTIVTHAAAGQMAFCGNGSPYIKKGTWIYKNKFIRLAVTGGYFAAGTYSYDKAYKIVSFEKGLLVLKKAKTYKNKRCETCMN